MDSSGNLANPQSMPLDSGNQGLAAAAGHGAGTRMEVREPVLTPHKPGRVLSLCTVTHAELQAQRAHVGLGSQRE